MKEMSISRQRARDLVTAYDHSLERQIAGQGSNLACRDEELWQQVEGLLRDGDAQETHCLGLDALKVMEESLKATASSTGRVQARGGLQGLAKAFEVLEQVALNLYLGPWREEYKVVKMYSGMFTHYIKPVLSMPQIEKLFGLLGYQFSSSRQEQLHLRVSLASLEDVLRFSCAFFLARCECRLLLMALGKHFGDAQWELNLVRERQTGNSLQVALDKTKTMLEINQPLKEPFGEAEQDLYTDEVNGQHRQAVVDDESPRSLTWVTQSSASAPAVETHINGVTSKFSSSTSPSTREDVCISTFNCHLTNTSPKSSNTTRSSSATCAFHSHCVVSPDNTKEEMEESRAVSPQGGSLCVSGMSASITLTSSSSAMSSLALGDDDPKSIISPLPPITYHDCCDLTQLDPQVLCLSCNVFHSGSCRTALCQTHHTIKQLGVCSCGRACLRKPLVLCRYCGNEYCRDCWYRCPVVCICGQTFDQSSSV